MSSSSDPSPRDSAIPAVDDTPLCDGRFVPYRRLGGGSQAQTYEGVDRLNGSVVAIKRFDVHGASSWKDVELAEREARVLSTLRHPSLPTYVHHFEEAGALYLVTERVDGEDLAKRLEAGHRFSYAELLGLLETLTDTFRYLHQRSPPIVHRDIKPSNIVQRLDGGYSVIDFGSVRDGLRPAGGSTVVGTFGFMAPEQFQGRALPASDFYGAGATLITLMTGLSPERLPHRGLEIDVRRSLPASTPQPWLALLEHLLRADPDQRLVDLHAMLPALRASAQDASARAHAGSESHSAQSNRGHADHPSGAEAPRAATDPRPSADLHHHDSEWIFSGGTTLPWLVIVVLSVLQVALFFSLQLAIPTLLTLLSVLFGKSFRDAATNVSRAGEHATQQLGLVIQRIAQAGPMSFQRRYGRPPARPSRTARSRIAEDWPSPAPNASRDARPARRIRVGSFDVELPEESPSERAPEPPRRNRQ